MKQRKAEELGKVVPRIGGAEIAQLYARKAGVHDNRPKRQRTRQSANRAAIRDNGWR